MEGCRRNRNGDVELVLSFPTQLESPKTESGCQSYGQNGAEDEICFSAKTGWKGRILQRIFGGHSGLAGYSGESTPETPVWAHLCRKLRPGGGDSGRDLPVHQEHDRNAIWAKKHEQNRQIEGANEGIRLWEHKGR